jgi:hypothetical protein
LRRARSEVSAVNRLNFCIGTTCPTLRCDLILTRGCHEIDKFKHHRCGAQNHTGFASDLRASRLPRQARLSPEVLFEEIAIDVLQARFWTGTSSRRSLSRRRLSAPSRMASLQIWSWRTDRETISDESPQLADESGNDYSHFPSWTGERSKAVALGLKSLWERSISRSSDYNLPRAHQLRRRNLRHLRDLGLI